MSQSDAGRWGIGSSIAALAILIALVHLYLLLGPQSRQSLSDVDIVNIGVEIGLLASAAVVIILRMRSAVWRKNPLLQVLIVVGCMFIGSQFGKSFAEERLRQRLVPFEGFARYPLDWSKRNLTSLPKVASVRGKIIMIADGGRVSPLIVYLPDNLRPATPEEVGTIAYVDCRNQDVGSYVSENDRSKEVGVGMQQVCNVTLVDRLSGDYIARQTFFGGAPPEKIEARPGEYARRTASVSEGEILGYLRGLPRR